MGKENKGRKPNCSKNGVTNGATTIIRIGIAKVIEVLSDSIGDILY